MVVLCIVLVALLSGLGFAAMRDPRFRGRVPREQVAASVTGPEMARVIEQLRPTLEPPRKVRVPVPVEERPYVWRSPSGKMVYLN